MDDEKDYTRIAAEALERIYSEAAINKIHYLCSRLNRDVPKGLESLPFMQLYGISLSLEMIQFNQVYGSVIKEIDESTDS